MIKPSVDYRQFRFSRLNTPEFSHVWLLLYWPLFGLGFSYVERFYPVAHYINMHCALDDLIPFRAYLKTQTSYINCTKSKNAVE